jgi:hypothetical protein
MIGIHDLRWWEVFICPNESRMMWCTCSGQQLCLLSLSEEPDLGFPGLSFVTGYVTTASFFLRIVEQKLSVYQSVPVERYEQNRNQQTEEEIESVVA